MTTVRAFIVEDSALILENLRATLEEVARVRVVGSAPDEASAMKWLQEHPGGLDLLLIDIYLKQGSGMGLLRATSAPPPSYKRAVLTNYATADMRTRCARLGADKFFDKSEDLEGLLAYCEEVKAGLDAAAGSS